VLSATFHTLLSIRYLSYATFHTLPLIRYFPYATSHTLLSIRYFDSPPEWCETLPMKGKDPSFEGRAASESLFHARLFLKEAARTHARRGYT